MPAVRAAFLAAALSCLSLAVYSSAAAQPLPPEELTRRTLTQALDLIQNARCGDKPCEPVTAAEKSNPPLTVTEAQRIIARGVVSAIAERCGLDWRRQNFLPMMAYWRTGQKKSERQMALVALLHGITQGQAEQSLQAQPPCTDQQRSEIAARLPFRP